MQFDGQTRERNTELSGGSAVRDPGLFPCCCPAPPHPRHPASGTYQGLAQDSMGTWKALLPFLYVTLLPPPDLSPTADFLVHNCTPLGAAPASLPVQTLVLCKTSPHTPHPTPTPTPGPAPVKRPPQKGLKGLRRSSYFQQIPHSLQSTLTSVTMTVLHQIRARWVFHPHIVGEATSPTGLGCK